MADVNWYNKPVQLDTSFIHSIWQPMGMFEASAKKDVNDMLNAQLEYERLNEWRENIAKIRKSD